MIFYLRYSLFTYPVQSTLGAYTRAYPVPILILYVFLQRYIVEGVTSGAVKG